MADDQENEDRELLRDRDVAKLYGVSERTVRDWRAKGAVQTVRTPGGRPRTVHRRGHGLEPGPTD